VLRPVNAPIAKLTNTVARYPCAIFQPELPARWAILRVVGKRVELSLEDDWGGRAPRTQVVVIGVAAGVRGAMLGGQFRQFVAQEQPVQPTPARSGDLE
jgi:hypothetical protein